MHRGQILNLVVQSTFFDANTIFADLGTTAPKNVKQKLELQLAWKVMPSFCIFQNS